MFDAVTIRRLIGPDSLDFGLLAESLVFYDRVNLILNASQFATLLRVCGYDVVRDLLAMQALAITYLENGIGVRTQNAATPNEMHDFVIYDFKKHYLQNYLPDALREILGKDGRARRAAEKLKRGISPSRYEASVNDETLEDVSGGSYVKESIVRIVREVAPEYQLPDPFLFELIRDRSTLRVSTNLDFAALNASYHKRVSPEHSTLTVGYLLSLFHETTVDLRLASSHDSELALAPLTTLIAGTRLEGILRQRLRSEESQSLFQEFVFNDASALRDAVNNRHKNMRDVVSLLSRAHEFRKWVRAQPESTDLRKAYLAEVSKLGWTEQLPRKTVRWTLFTAAGLAMSVFASPIAGAVAGVALNTFDYFLLDKLAQGWKPNQFVEGPLRQFITE